MPHCTAGLTLYKEAAEARRTPLNFRKCESYKKLY